MADRRRAAGRKAAKEEPQSNELSKEEEALAKFVRFNCPTKTAMFQGNEVNYFQGRKAIDTLMESKKYGPKAKDPKFTTRPQAIDFLTSLLQRGLLFRARVFVAKKKDDPRREKREQAGESPRVKKEDLRQAKKEAVSESPRVKRIKQAEESAKEGGDTGAESGAEQQPKREEESSKKKKVKLEIHNVQTYNDDSDVYVWVFDPTPFYKKVIGLLIVLGVIVACLFPLWPGWLRLGIYYLSVTGIALFGLLLGVALARTVLFGVIYAATFGRHKLWILPNLTEDCGFFESFKPWYTYEYCADDSKDKKKRKKSTEEEPLVEDINKERASTSKQSNVPADPKPKHDDGNETDPEEKYSKPSSDEDSAAEEDEVDEDEAVTSATASTGDSSEPAEVVKLDEEHPDQEAEKPAVEEAEKPAVEEKSQPTTPEASKPAKPRRRRVRRADKDDDEGYVVVNH